MVRHELWVAGYPSYFGGADTELDHNIDLWVANSVQVHLVPMSPWSDPAVRALCDARGCVTQAHQPGISKGKTFGACCTGEILEALPRIVEEGRPRSVVWFNCMTWTFPAEVAAHTNGWIDLHGFVSRYQRGILKPALEAHRPVR